MILRWGMGGIDGWPSRPVFFVFFFFFLLSLFYSVVFYDTWIWEYAGYGLVD